MSECRQYCQYDGKITIGRRGAITIPAKMRRKLGLEQDGELIAETTEQGILLRPAVSIPIEMVIAQVPPGNG